MVTTQLCPCSLKGALDNIQTRGVTVLHFTYKTWRWGGCNLLTPDSGDGGQKTGLGLALSCSDGKFLFFFMSSFNKHLNSHIRPQTFGKWKVKVAQSRPTLCDTMDYTIHGILQAISLLQGIFPTQGSNTGLLHCRWILYQLSHKGRSDIGKNFINIDALNYHNDPINIRQVFTIILPGLAQRG